MVLFTQTTDGGGILIFSPENSMIVYKSENDDISYGKIKNDNWAANVLDRNIKIKTDNESFFKNIEGEMFYSFITLKRLLKTPVWYITYCLKQAEKDTTFYEMYMYTPCYGIKIGVVVVCVRNEIKTQGDDKDLKLGDTLYVSDIHIKENGTFLYDKFGRSININRVKLLSSD